MGVGEGVGVGEGDAGSTSLLSQPHCLLPLRYLYPRLHLTVTLTATVTTCLPSSHSLAPLDQVERALQSKAPPEGGLGLRVRVKG